MRSYERASSTCRGTTLSTDDGGFHLDDCKGRTLRILKDRETTYTRDVISRLDCSSSQLSRLLYLGIAVVNGEIHQPKRRDAGHLRSQLEHSPSSPVAVLKNRVVRRPESLRIDSPAKYTAIKRACPCCILRCQFIPNQGPRHVYDYGALVFLSLQDREARALRILDH